MACRNCGQKMSTTSEIKGIKYCGRCARIKKATGNLPPRAEVR